MRILAGQKNPEKDRARQITLNHISISIKITMENYFESLNESDKLAYRKKLMLESGETLPDP